MSLNQCHHTKGVYLEVYSNNLQDYTATHHANTWYIMGVATTDITTWVVTATARSTLDLLLELYSQSLGALGCLW
jgi:predicted branched-subunit amino acid permease